MATQSSVALSSQNVTIPQIHELFDPHFLDALVPRSNVDTSMVDEDTSAPSLGNSLLTTALTENRDYTQGHAPAFSSTGSATLGAVGLIPKSKKRPGKKVTLRLIC
jgi:hypothetical protein